MEQEDKQWLDQGNMHVQTLGLEADDARMVAPTPRLTDWKRCHLDNNTRQTTHTPSPPEVLFGTVGNREHSGTLGYCYAQPSPLRNKGYVHTPSLVCVCVCFMAGIRMSCEDKGPMML